MPKRKGGAKKKRDEEYEEEENLSEAMEVKNSISDEDNKGEPEPSGEDLEEEFENDYQANPLLDKYEDVGIDDEKYAALPPEERRKIDQKLNQRDMRGKALLPKRILGSMINIMEDADDEQEEAWRIKRRKMMAFGEPGENEDDFEDIENALNQQEVKGKEGNWLQEERTMKYIRTIFSKFCKNYKEGQNSPCVYEERIKVMGQNNKQSFEVNFPHLYSYNQYLGKWVLLYPEIVLPYLNDVGYELTNEIYPHYESISKEVFVRIRDLPNPMNIRDLRCNNIGRLIKLKGVITKRSVVYPKLRVAFFACVKCGEKNGPFYFNSPDDEINIGSCPVCQSNGPYTLDQTETLYRNYQRVTIQESPGTVPPGRVPRQKEIILTNDLADSARPGDEIEISGIFKSRYDLSSNVKNCFPIFNTFIEVNCLKRMNDIDIEEITDIDKEDILKLSKKQNIADTIINSIAPSIYGNEFIKKALATSLFGGMPKDPQGKHRIRGDINVLLLGDPGTAKSQFLKYIQKVFNRSIYTTGKGASAVGLTASVQKDSVTREWTLEGGALVLADKGICLIDEFDKMNDQDRTSIHEAMEQQSISISKAGIVTSLQARCSVIAAANPLKGRYDNVLSFSDNVELTEPILSRFDILCVVKDEIDRRKDDQLATFVINSHINSHPEGNKNKIELEDRPSLIDIENSKKEKIPQELLKKYIIYARKNIHPKLNDVNKEKISKFYSDLRKESENAGGIMIAVRHLESLLRICEARAKMCLRENVNHEDVDFAIQIILESFLQSQKYSISKVLRKKFSQYLVSGKDKIPLLMNLLGKVAETRFQMSHYMNSRLTDYIKVQRTYFENEAKDIGFYSLDDFYDSSEFKKKYTFEGNKREYIKVPMNS